MIKCRWCGTETDDELPFCSDEHESSYQTAITAFRELPLPEQKWDIVFPKGHGLSGSHSN